jgi:hypothetical protein
MKTYRVSFTLTTPYNPNKWDWEELVASEPDETVSSISCDLLWDDDDLVLNTEVTA